MADDAMPTDLDMAPAAPLHEAGPRRSLRDRRRQDRDDLRLNTALKIGRMVIWELDTRTGLVTRSDNAGELLGVQVEHIARFVERVHPDDRHKVAWERSDSPTPPTGDVEFRYLHPNGTWLWLRSGAIQVDRQAESHAIIGITTDITEQKLAEAKLVHVASHDALTGLLNRKAWTQWLDGAVASADSRGGKLCLVLFDVDFFKTINDTFGHDAGDCVLEAIGLRLRAIMPPIIASARLGGDEFAAVLRVDPDFDDLDRLSDLLIRKIGEPIAHEGRFITVGCSIGVACFLDHAETAGDLVKNADLALYAAKEAGRRQAVVFRPEMRIAREAHTSLETEFKAALAAGQIVPYYQPKIDLVTGALMGFEALARWVHPTRGLLTPGVFGRVFADGPIAIEVGRTMRGAVLRDVRRWLMRGLTIGRVSVNIANHEFRLLDLASTMLDELHQAGVPPSAFEIEVTEGVMIGRDAGKVEAVLTALHDAGVKISLDDFGTGYASLIHLKQFPVDEIKLDRSFVAEIDREPNPAIIRAILVMGQSLGLTTVAEGIETRRQADTLLEMGCTQGQGYLFGRPMAATRVPWFVRQGRKVASSPEAARA